MKFIDFNVTIGSMRDQLYVSAAYANGQPIIEARSPLQKQDIELLRSLVEKDGFITAMLAKALEVPTRATITETDEKLRTFGKDIFDWVFCGRILELFNQRYEQAQEDGCGLRIRLSIDEKNQYVGMYPFEVMYYEQLPIRNHLALFGGLTVVRSLGGQGLQPQRQLKPITPPLRILIAKASPAYVRLADQKIDLKPIDLEDKELKRLEQALNLPGIVVKTLRNSTLDKLINVAKGIEPHVLHFIGHGFYNSQTEEGNLILEKDNTPEGEIVSASDLTPLIANIKSLRLVTLNACLGTKDDGVELSSSVAMGIFSLRIPAVVAMQYVITDAAAIEFSKSFYGQLAMGRSVDDAMTLTRAHVRRKIKGSPEWATPVLYLGTPDGEILNLRLKPEELISRALAELREANWDTSTAVAELIQEQNFDVPLVLDQAKIIQASAYDCEQFSKAWAAAQQLAEQGDQAGHQNLDAVVGQARDFDTAQLERVLKGDLGVCSEVVTAVEATRAFEQEEYDKAIELCGQVSDPQWASFKFLLERAIAEQEARKVLDHLREVWDSGDWNAIQQTTEEILAKQLKGTRQQRELEEKATCARQLRNAMDAISRHEFNAALSILEKVKPQHAPLNLSLCMQALAVGVALTKAVDSGDLDAIAGMDNKLQELSEESDRLLPMSVPGLAQVREKCCQAVSEVHYQEALRLYDSGLFAESKEAFFKLLSQGTVYKDSQKKLDLCEAWISIEDKLRQGQWDEAKQALDKLRNQEKSSRVQIWHRWSTRARKLVPALKQIANPLVFDQDVLGDGSEHPYSIFAPLGISPSSSMKECDQAGFGAQDKPGGMTQGERSAWDTLRIIQSRLMIDFPIYTVSDSLRASDLLQRICIIEEGKDPGMAIQDLLSELKEDEGILLTLLKYYDQAIEFFLKEARRRPYDITSLHHLGTAAAAKAHWVEKHGGYDEELIKAWEHMIIGWAPVFANENFWHNWWISRRNIYQVPISEKDIQDARQRLQQFWLDQLKSAADVCPGLDVIFQSEVKGASAVNAGKGIPLIDHPGKSAVVGMLGSKALGIQDSLAQWTASFEPDSLQKEGWQQRVLRYFSEIAEASALYEEGQYEESIATLSVSRCELQRRGDVQCSQTEILESRPHVAGKSCPCFVDANPSFRKLERGADLLAASAFDLVGKAHFKVAVEAVSNSPTNVKDSMAHWRAAVRLVGHDKIEELLSQIQEVVVGRANFLISSEGERSLDNLNDAVELLQESINEGWDSNDKLLENTLVNSLLARAMHLSAEYSSEADARRDALRACNLAPESLMAVLVLIQTSLRYAVELYYSGKNALAQALVEDVKSRLEETEKTYPGNPSVELCRGYFDQTSTMIANQGTDALNELLNTVKPLTQDVLDHHTHKLVEAMTKEAQKEFPEAIKLLSEMLGTDPTNQEIQARMAYCYRAWIFHLLDNGLPDDAQWVADEAFSRFPDSDILNDLPKYLQEKW